VRAPEVDEVDQRGIVDELDGLAGALARLDRLVEARCAQLRRW
jgi:hypothetical protein